MQKPQSRTNKYRNLYVPKSRGTIHYARMIDGERVAVDTKCSPATIDGWRDAAAFRDRYEELKGIGKPRSTFGAVPTFGELAPLYLESVKFAHLAATTQEEARYKLTADSALLSKFASAPIDEITADDLTEWLEAQAKAKGWSTQTCLHYLTAVASVLKLGRKYLNGRALPTVEARERIGEQRRTAKGRADAGSHIRAVADPEAIDALLTAAREQSVEVGAFVTALLDAGPATGRGARAALAVRRVGSR